MNALYPFQGRFLDRDGLKLHYLDEGSGEPVVMLHGNPTWSFFWRKLVLALRPQCRTIAPDHIGCGRSDKPSLERYDYSLRSRIDDLAALLEHLGVRTAITLVAHDWGGMIGMGYAARHPERIKRLVLMNTAAFQLPEGKRLPLALRLGRNTRLGAWLIRRMNLFCLTAAWEGVKRRALGRAVRSAYLAPYDSPANRVAVLRFVQSIPLSPADPGFDIVKATEAALPRFATTPALICWGLRDFVFDAKFLKEWERHLPHAEVHRFEDAGHYLMEDAGDEVVALVRDFLARNP